MAGLAAVLGGSLIVACGESPAEVDGGSSDAIGDQQDAVIDGFTPSSCDPVFQSGCSNGEKCSIIPSQYYGGPSRIGCVADLGSLGFMEVCERASYMTPDYCRRGLACVGSATPRCLPFCFNYPFDTCDSDQVCAFSDDLDGDLEDDVHFCGQTCDVLAQDCGDPALGCYPTREAAVCATEGAGGTPVQAGEPCDHANSCEAGLGCFQVGSATDFVCLELCDPYGSGPGCSWPLECNPVEYEAWGVCVDAG